MIRTMRRIKGVLDPHNIMNPHKVLTLEESAKTAKTKTTKGKLTSTPQSSYTPAAAQEVQFAK